MSLVLIHKKYNTMTLSQKNPPGEIMQNNAYFQGSLHFLGKSLCVTMSTWFLRVGDNRLTIKIEILARSGEPKVKYSVIYYFQLKNINVFIMMIVTMNCF